MKIKGSHFRYTNSERNGILFLAVLIVTLQLVYFFSDFSGDPLDSPSEELLAYQKEIDSLHMIATENATPKIFPFNPSFLTDARGYQLGMSTEEIDRLLEHRKAGKYVNSPEEFQKITGISDSLLVTISPYFKFPDWVVKKQQNISRKRTISDVSENKKNQILDLNTATVDELQTVKGIGEKLAHRIVNYRNKLEGFSVNDQLYEVYYLDKEVANKVLDQFQVLTPPTIEKINVNTASFKEVLSIAYIDYELTKNIFDYRDEVAEIQSLDELKNIDGFPIDKFDRIALYLQAK